MPPTVCPAPQVLTNKKEKPPPVYRYDPITKRFVRCY